MTQLTLNIENVDGVSVAHERKTSATQRDDVEGKAIRSALRQAELIHTGRIKARPVEDLLNEI